MKLRPLVSLLVSLGLICPSTSFAKDPGAVGRLTTEGKAQVNSISVPAGATVFDGDLVSVVGKGLATIALDNGSRVLVTENSGARLHRQGEQTRVRIAHGTVAVMNRTETGLVMNAQGLLIRPATDAPTSYAARIEEHAVVLTSVTGDVLVEGLTSTHTVPAGKSMRFDLDYPQGSEGAGAGTGLSTVVKALIVTAFVAAIVIPVVLYNTGDPVSP